MTDIGPVDHHPAKQRELRQWRTNQLERLAEQPPVERVRLQRAPGECRALQLRAVVGMTNIGPQFHFGMIFQNLDCRGTRFQEGCAQRNVGMVSDDLLQIFFDARRAFGRTERRCMARIGYPDRSGRQRRRAADTPGLHDQQRLRASNGGKKCRRHAGGSGTDHDDVVTGRDLG